MDGILSAIGWNTGPYGRARLVVLFATITTVYLLFIQAVESTLGVSSILVHGAGWLIWFVWQGFLFERRRNRYIERRPHEAYKRMFWTDILFGASLCFALLLNPVAHGNMPNAGGVNPVAIAAGVVLVASGFGMLAAAISTIGFDAAGFLFEYYDHKEFTMVERGIYAHMRHPLFLGGVFCSVGLALLFVSMTSLSLALVNVSVIFVYRRTEDNRLSNVFSERYEEYRSNVDTL